MSKETKYKEIMANEEEQQCTLYFGRWING